MSQCALHDGLRERPAVHAIGAPQAELRLQSVLELIEQHKHKWALPTHVRVVVSYEAGQDGFWILRALSSRGIECYMVDAASIPVQRHKRRAKTDRLDAIKLVTNLRAWLHGERDRMRVVRAPSSGRSVAASDPRSQAVTQGSAAAPRAHAQAARHARLLG